MKICKIIGTRIKAIGMGAALFGSLFCISPVTVFAGGPTCTCEEKCTEDHVDEDCPICREDYRNCEGTEPEEPVTEHEEDWGPLTPDGNMNLVDDYGSIEAGGKQFITVTTKNGNFFYIIIDRDDDGNETVHFLNMVDESDLLSLMDDEAIDKYISVTGLGSKKEKEEPVKVTPEPVKEPEPVVEPETPKKSTNVNGIMALILVLGLAGVGGFMYFNTTKNSKKKPATADPDADFREDGIINLPSEAEETDYQVDASEDDATENEKGDEA